ncbi:tetratricopeptide repeat-containing diguanylate cyclase [Ideonella paludis]|uniref:diguanylate cyclase n=1 Tax=Ideonella paludis TaxID=1233411 RepID=A0ABS5E0E6_9BURK|nr:GGDEF domain-containing protein [Ideonella paludis]MBQ0936871.1 GGDEF domain-containing protein [Ideonella paludis]
MKWAALLLLAFGIAPCAQATALTDTLDKLERQGRESPEPALKALEALKVSRPDDEFRRQVTKGLILAANGRAKEARALADALRQANPVPGDSDGQAAADMVLAQLAQVEAQPEATARLAQSGLARLQSACAQQAPTCGWRLRWQLEMLASGAARIRGLDHDAQQLADSALTIAQAHQDPYRQSLSTLSLAIQAMRVDELDAAEARLREARQWAERSQEPDMKVRVLMFTAELHQRRNDLPGVQMHLREALALAQSAQLTRQTSNLWINLSDWALNAGRPQEAIRMLNQAHHGVRALNDRRLEATLHHNLGMARIALGQIAAGKREVEMGLALWEGSGAHDELAACLQEYSEALARVGDTSGALSAYHRERKLKREAMAADRETALASLHNRFERDAQKREIELQARENAVQRVRLDNHQARQRLWVWLAVLAGLIMVVLGLLVRRMRQAQQLLRRRQDDLRVQSEQDSLTGLANRRCLQRSLQAAQGSRGEYCGGLLLIDLDHFKRINDDYGHSGGDLVLKEVARRLSGLMGPGDVLGRWGGEEFAIHLNPAQPARGAQMAQAVLAAIGERPFELPTVSLTVTASVGFGAFPLSPDSLLIRWEQALNLADMALYLAKTQGRNQALGIRGLQVDGPEALADIEADFDDARRSGKVQLQAVAGPALHNPAHASQTPSPRLVEADGAVRPERAAVPSECPEPGHHGAESGESSRA